MLASKVYWQFPAGTVRCLSVRELVRARLSDLDTADSRAAYDGVAASLSYTFLGVAADAEALAAFTAATGNVQESGGKNWTGALRTVASMCAGG